MDILRKKFKKPYGNRELHTSINEAMEDYKMKPGAIYPMFVREKELPYANKVVSTEIYNLIVMVVFSVLLALFSILMLAYREKITKLQLYKSKQSK